MRHYTAVILTVVFSSAITGPSPVSAQQVSSFEQLQLLVKPGDKIEVFGTDGLSKKGRIESLTPTTLRLSIKGGIRDYAQKDALLIKQKRSDSLANGAIIGGVAGGGIGGGVIAAYCSGGYCSGDTEAIVAGTLIYAGIGVAIGVGVDALFKHRQTIYKLPEQTALKSIRVAPLLTDGRKGAMLRVSF
jgi:hypothetical protein